MSVSPLVHEVAASIHDALAVLAPELPISIEEVAAACSAPPSPELGDVAFACFRLAKLLRKAPPTIATVLAGRLDTTGIIETASAAGPYVNLRLSLGTAADLVLSPLARGLPEPTATRKGTVMVEYSQPNTHKAFHVGHMRNLALGDALVRLLRADGFPVIAANYLGDVGAHIAKCLWWYLDVLDDAGRVPPDSARGEWLGELYAAASNRLEEWEDAAKAGDEAAAQSLATARSRIGNILHALEAREPTITAEWAKTRQWSLEEFDEIYRWTGVTFDRVFYESEVDEPGLRLVEEYLAKGVFVESEGAVGIFNEEIKHMPFFMLRKRDGTSLYSTKDLALARLKFDEHAVQRSIYVVDVRQSDHFRHVFLTLAKMGFTQAARCEHVPYEMVELPDGPMATRKGNIILFRTLRERMISHLRTAYLAKYEGVWPEEEIAETAHRLALGAIKYGMLARDVNQRIVFDMEAWMELEGDTGPYLQYAAARVGSILRRAAEEGAGFDPAALDDDDRREAAAAALVEPEERAVVLALADLHVRIHQAAEALRPSTLCSYLHDLAKAINRFVTSKRCHVLTATGALRDGRLMLAAAAREALVWGMARVGIPAPNRM